MKIRVKSMSKKTAKPAKKMEKIKDKKSAKKTEKKAVAKRKTKAKKPIKSKKEIKEQKKTVTKKPAVRKAEKEKKTAVRKKATEKAIKKEPKKIALPTKKIPKIPQRTLQKVEKSPSLPAVTTKKGLPAEYGEDRITLMTVDPWKLFAYWEVKENTLSKIKGTLVLRVYDVTGIYFDGKNANLVFDVPVYGRLGDTYVGVGPDKAFIVEIGAVSKEGFFVSAARSNQVSTPPLKVAKEEGALPEEIYEVGPVTGYV